MLAREKSNINSELERYLDQRANQWKKENKNLRKADKIRVKRKKQPKVSKLSKKTKSKLESSEGDVVIIEESPENWFQRFMNSFFNLFSHGSEENIESEEMEEYVDEKAKDLNLSNEEEEEVNEELDEEKDNSINEGFLLKIKRWFSNLFKGTKDQEIIELEQQSQIDADEMEKDLKDVLKVVNHMIVHLPTKCLAVVKNSDDFKEYKSYINKYNLIWAAKKRIELLKKEKENESDDNYDNNEKEDKNDK